MELINLIRKGMPKNIQLYVVGLFIYLSMSSCKVTETTIQDITAPNNSWTTQHDSIYVLCSTYYLRHFDTIHKTKKSPFKYDLFVAKRLVDESLKSLYAADSAMLKKFVLCTTPKQIRSYKYIDVQLHVFINWWGLIPMAQVRESICIKSSIVTNGSIIKSHEEWGFRKTLGDFYDLADGYGECAENDYNLKLYCIKKSLVELSKSF